MIIPEQLKNKFINRDGIKVVKLEFPSLGLTINNDKIYEDSLSLEERLVNGDSIEFVGCLSSIFSIEIHDITAKLKNQKIVVSMTMQEESTWIPLFVGYVDSVKTRLEDSWKGLTCYDELYYKANSVDVSAFYNSIFPAVTTTKTIKQFRDALFSHLGIVQEAQNLVNDNVVIKKEYDPKILDALKVIKAICQFNGVFVRINRYGKFEYMTLSGGSEGLFPSQYTFPGNKTFPGGYSLSPDSERQTVFLYMDMECEDYNVAAIDKVQVRKNEDDEGTSFGTGSNIYVVQNNMFAYGLSSVVLNQVAKNIYSKVSGFSYFPFDATQIGYPFVEVGAKVQYIIADYTSGNGTVVNKSSFILSRRLKGIQNLTDEFIAKGNEFQSVFISDLQTQLDTIKRSGGGGGLDPDKYYTKDEMDRTLEEYKRETTEDAEEIVDTAISEMETPTGLAFASVYILPNAPRADTLYGLTGGVILL